jgi:hypothetical protein
MEAKLWLVTVYFRGQWRQLERGFGKLSRTDHEQIANGIRNYVPAALGVQSISTMIRSRYIP